MKRSKEEYENDIAALIGKQLKRVRYFELCYETETAYSSNPLFNGHLLDYGCDLEMADGSIFGILWDGEFFQYGVGISKASLSARLPSARVWDLTGKDHWLSLIGQTITKAMVHWAYVQDVGSQERHYYPQDVELGFCDGSVIFFSASQYNEDKDALRSMSDDTAIIFGNETAQKYGIGPYVAKNSLKS